MTERVATLRAGYKLFRACVDSNCEKQSNWFVMPLATLCVNL